MAQEILTYTIIVLAIGAMALRLGKKYARKSNDTACTTGERPESKGCGGCDADCPFKK